MTVYTVHIDILNQNYFIVKIDGTEIGKVENKEPVEFKNVQVLSGDTFNEPANARYRSLVYKNLLKGTKFNQEY